MLIVTPRYGNCADRKKNNARFVIPKMLSDAVTMIKSLIDSAMNVKIAISALMI